MKCINCGNELEDGAKFCGACGSRVKPVMNLADAGGLPGKRANDTKFLIIILVLAVLLLGMSAFVGFLFYQNNTSKNAKNSDISNTQSTETKKETDNGGENAKNPSKVEVNNYYYGDPGDGGSDYCSYDYIFPSDSEYVTADDLYGKTKTEVALMRNEIYARHGYIFETEPYKSYFNSKYWYVPDKHFNENMLSKLEKENKDFIVEYEKSMGWR